MINTYEADALHPRPRQIHAINSVNLIRLFVGERVGLLSLKNFQIQHKHKQTSKADTEATITGFR